MSKGRLLETGTVDASSMADAEARSHLNGPSQAGEAGFICEAQISCSCDIKT
jgi:hypothetical protein